MNFLRTIATVATLLAAAGASGCGWWAAESARMQTVERELDTYVIPKPLAEVWPRAKEAKADHDQLFWDGLSTTWQETGPFTMRTQTKSEKPTTSNGETTVESYWYECRGEEAPGGSRVHYTRWTESTSQRKGQTPTTRRTDQRRSDLELSLVRLMDPTAAQRIESAGETSARATRK